MRTAVVPTSQVYPSNGLRYAEIVKGGLVACALALLLVSCSADQSQTTSTRPPDSFPPSTTAALSQANSPTPSPPIRLLFAGDVMLGRKIAEVAESDPEGLFEDVRFVVSSADIAVANLESPMTVRPNLTSGEDLNADPIAARLLGAAGFDAMGIANNHAGDAGPESVLDTIAALEAAALAPIGGGSTASDAMSPQIIEHAGVRVAYLAFDATGQGSAAAATPGVAQWNVAGAQEAVASARAVADVVTVGLHGGIEYSTATDPQLQRLGELLASWNVDVVWGHGAHVSQPVDVIDPDGDGQVTVVATSLGNFLFDQGRRSTTSGTVLEVLAGREGVAAWRIGTTEHEDLRVHFDEWELPGGNAVLLGGDWWNLPRTPEIAAKPDRPDVIGFTHGTVVDATDGDVTGDGIEDVVVAYRRPFRPTVISDLYPDIDFIDANGDSAHIGVFEPGSFRPLWGAGTLLEPIERVLACDNGVAVGYSELDDRTVTAAGALSWDYFGVTAAPRLPGPGVFGCSDLDRDGHADPVVLNRP